MKIKLFILTLFIVFFACANAYPQNGKHLGNGGTTAAPQSSTQSIDDRIAQVQQQIKQFIQLFTGNKGSTGGS